MIDPNLRPTSLHPGGSLNDIGARTKKSGHSVTKLFRSGALVIVALPVMIGLVAGCSDDSDTTEGAPTTTEAADPESIADTDPAVIAVLDVFGRCLELSGMELDGATVTSGPSPSTVRVTFPNGAQFVVPTEGPVGPMVVDGQADIALDLGEAVDPDCLL